MAYSPGSKQAEAGGALTIQQSSRTQHQLRLAAAPSSTAALPGTGVAGGGGGVPIPGLSYASMVGGWVSATLCLCRAGAKMQLIETYGHTGELLDDVILALPCMGRVRAPLCELFNVVSTCGCVLFT